MPAGPVCHYIHYQKRKHFPSYYTALFHIPETDEEGMFLPHSPPLSPLVPKVPYSFSELVPHFLDQSYAHG